MLPSMTGQRAARSLCNGRVSRECYILALANGPRRGRRDRAAARRPRRGDAAVGARAHRALRPARARGDARDVVAPGERVVHGLRRRRRRRRRRGRSVRRGDRRPRRRAAAARAPRGHGRGRRALRGRPVAGGVDDGPDGPRRRRRKRRARRAVAGPPAARARGARRRRRRRRARVAPARVARARQRRRRGARAHPRPFPIARRRGRADFGRQRAGPRRRRELRVARRRRPVRVAAVALARRFWRLSEPRARRAALGHRARLRRPRVARRLGRADAVFGPGGAARARGRARAGPRRPLRRGPRPQRHGAGRGRGEARALLARAQARRPPGRRRPRGAAFPP